MKEIKDWQMKCRLSQKEKEKVLEYCEQHDLTISEFVRLAVNRIFGVEDGLK